MVTVYVFIPSDMRVNYPVDSENLAERALITSYRDTWEDGKDYSGLIALARKGSASDNGDLQATPQFALSVPGRGTLTSLQDFRNTAPADLQSNGSTYAHSSTARKQNLRHSESDTAKATSRFQERFLMERLS